MCPRHGELLQASQIKIYPAKQPSLATLPAPYALAQVRDVLLTAYANGRGLGLLFWIKVYRADGPGIMVAVWAGGWCKSA